MDNWKVFAILLAGIFIGASNSTGCDKSEAAGSGSGRAVVEIRSNLDAVICFQLETAAEIEAECCPAGFSFVGIGDGVVVCLEN